MKLLHITIIVTAILPLAYFVAPTETKVELKESIARMTNDPGQICLDYARSDLKDPMSAKLFSTERVIEEDTKTCSIKEEWKCYKIKYHAKNSYGAYVVGSKVCAISNDNNKVSEGATASYEKIAALDADIARLNFESAVLRFQTLSGRRKCDPGLVDAVILDMRKNPKDYPPMDGVPVMRESIASKIQALYPCQR